MIAQQNSSFKIDLELKNAIGFQFNWIPSGTFMMGSPTSEIGRNAYDDEMPFEVTISKGFWLSVHLITNAQWTAIMGDFSNSVRDTEINCPVTNINWYEAINFCDKLNQRYSNKVPKGYFFSLPTEAQWEYACRAGTTSVFHSGDSIDDLSRVAWHSQNSDGRLHAVGEKEPNAWGVYDMHGSLSEWCYDAPIPYPNVASIDWEGQKTNLLDIRSIRGEPWSSPPTSPGFRSSCRGNYPASDRLRYIGFRVSLRFG